MAENEEIDDKAVEDEASSGGLAPLMSSEDGEGEDSLEALAMRAAEEAISIGEDVLDEFELDEPPPSGAPSAGSEAAASAEPEAAEVTSPEPGATASADPAPVAGTEAVPPSGEPRAEAAEAVPRPEPTSHAPPSVEGAVHQAFTGTATTARSASVAPVRVDPRRVWLLRGMLVLNLGLMGLMLAIPSPEQPAKVAGSAEHANPEAHSHAPPADPEAPPPYQLPTPERFVSQRRPSGSVMQGNGNYGAGMDAMKNRNWAVAVDEFEAVLKFQGGLTSNDRLLLYTMLARCADQVGRYEDSARYEAMAARERVPGSQPEDFLELAREAERNGDGRLMRQSYARFLLMRDQLSPLMESLVTEAYLRLGDSYRVEAEAGMERARGEEEIVLDKIKKINATIREQSRREHRDLHGNTTEAYRGKGFNALKAPTGGGH